MPMLLLTASAIGVLLFGTGRRKSPIFLGQLALFGTALALLATLGLWGRPGAAFPGALVLDRFTLLIHLILLAACGITVLFSFRQIGPRHPAAGEYYALLLFSTVGMMVLAAGANLLVIFLGLEILSISLYILAGFFRERPEGVEAAMKYFLLGAFSTCFILYGMAFLYGATGTLDLIRLGRSTAGASGGFFHAGMGLLIIGFSFKIAAAPFHFWAPDVYQGAPTSITGFMATATKAAAFAGLLRVLFVAFQAGEVRQHWIVIFSLLAIATMVVGNLVALAQEDVKRLLAYSSIAHVGYLLIALVSASDDGVRSVVYYLFAYTFMTLGAFGIVGLLARKEGGRVQHGFGEFAGLGFRNPLLAAAMSLFLLSLTGVPPTAGFMGKFYVFRAAMESDRIFLAVLGMIFSTISAYYYLRIIVYMYMREPAETAPVVRLQAAGTVAVALAAAATLYLGLFPTPLWGLFGNLL